MALRLENKNAIITGGASGIGRATAIRRRRGANVIVADRNLAASEQPARSAKIGRKESRTRSNQRRGAGRRDGRAHGRELGGVNIVVAAAGIPYAGYGEERHRTNSRQAFRQMARGAERQPRRRFPDRSRHGPRDGQGR